MYSVYTEAQAPLPPTSSLIHLLAHDACTALLPAAHGVLAQPRGHAVEVEAKGGRLAAVPRGGVRRRRAQQPVGVHVEDDLEQCRGRGSVPASTNARRAAQAPSATAVVILGPRH